MLKSDNHGNTKNFLDMMFSLGLYPLIDKPTRITDISATLINNIFTNELLHHLTSGILINDIINNLPIFAICEYKINRYIKKEVNHVRIINEDRLASFRKELNVQSRDNVLNTNDVNHAYDTIMHVLIYLFKKYWPVKTVLNKSCINKKP